MATADVAFREGQTYAIWDPKTELRDMTCIVREGPGVGGLVSDFARRDDHGTLTVYWLWSDQVQSQEGNKIETELDPKFIQRISSQQSVRFEHYDEQLRRFGR